MFNKILKATVVSALMGASLGAFAGEVGTGPNPYSDCGIGAAIFKDTEWAAVTSNVTWDLGLTALTSATASPQTCSKKNVKVALLVRDAYARILEDAARGEGQHLAAALEVYACQGAAKASAVEQVRSDVTRAVAAPGFAGQEHLDKASQLFNIINSAARQSCGA